MLDKRSDIFKVLVTTFKDGLTKVALVTDKPTHSEHLSANDYPAITLVEGGTRYIDEATSTFDTVMDVFVRIYTNNDDDLEIGRDLMDEMNSLLRADPQLNDTCMYAEWVSDDPPYTWVTAGGVNIRDKFMIVRYRRDID